MPRPHFAPTLLLVATLLVTGCAQSDVKPASRPPAPENVTIDLATDLGPLEPYTAPLARPGAANPPKPLLDALRPLTDGPLVTLVTLGDTVKFDGQFPGENGDWGKWDQGVEQLVRKQLATGKPVEFEMWNEPDRPASFKGKQADFFALWVHTARLIRSIDPKARLVGPTMSKYDYGWVQEFLKVGKEFSVLPDVVCWHEGISFPDLKGHINSSAEAFWQDGTNRACIRVHPSAALDRHYSPADPVLFLAALQEAWRETKFRGIDERLGIKLHHLTTKDHKPRSLFYAYDAYAKLLEFNGHAAKLASSKSVDGLAVWKKTPRTGQLLLGRKLPRKATTQLITPDAPPQDPAPLSITLKNIPGNSVTLSYTIIPDTAAAPLETKPSTPHQITLPVTNQGETKLPLPDLADGQACVIEFQVTGTPAPTRANTAPPTQPLPPVTRLAATRRGARPAQCAFRTTFAQPPSTEK